MSDYRPDIWRLQAQFDTQGLIEALKDEDAGYRKRAASALRALGVREAVPALRVAMVNEHDPDARAHIAAALDALTDDETDDKAGQPAEADEVSAEQTLLNRLIEQLNHPDQDKVIDAAKQLGDIKDKVAVEPLVKLFNNSKVSIRVRLAVAEALLQLESAPVEVTLLAVLRNSDWHIRRNGAAILGQLKAEWAVEPLTRALKDPHPIVRKTARAALRHIGTPEALGALKQNEKQRRAAAQKAMDSRKRRQDDDTTPEAPSGGLLKRVAGEQTSSTQAEEATRPKKTNVPPRKTDEGKASTEVEEAPSTEATTEDDAAMDPANWATGLEWPKSDETPAIHVNPTQPLDPSALEEAERRREADRKASTESDD